MDPVLGTMLSILGAQLAGLVALERATPRRRGGIWLAPRTNAPKRATEVWFLRYALVWVGAFALIIGLELYETFTAWTYFWVCGGLALPLVLQPVVYPRLTLDHEAPLAQRYAVKANVWLGIFGFVGNYWYTHYFYSVLGAAYTMPAHRFNDVPYCMFFATHFYFCFYHVLSNCALRRIATGYRPGAWRLALRIGTIGAMAYLTAFLETLTISGFPYYTFADRDRAYTVGSAFYGLYFVVSFPAFFSVDEVKTGTHALGRVVIEALAAAMAVLQLLDAVRLFLGIPLVIRVARPGAAAGGLNSEVLYTARPVPGVRADKPNPPLQAFTLASSAPP